MKILCTLEEYTHLIEDCHYIRFLGDGCKSCVHCGDCDGEAGIKGLCKVVPSEEKNDG